MSKGSPESAATGFFDVVAIGASAGGIEALQALAKLLPSGLPAAVLIVQHMDPRHKSMLAWLLARHCRLPVREAVHGEVIRPGTVYLAPPDVHLIARNGHLALTDTQHVHFTRPAIDLLFQSVADSYGDRAIGVILSGSGVDGAAGVRAIKAKGGTIIVQDPASAAHGGMPSAARATGCADATLRLDDIGPAIATLVLGFRGDET